MIMPKSMRNQRDKNNFLIVQFDQADRQVNTITPQLFDELEQLVTELENESYRGVVFTSSKPDGFIAGADLFEMAQMDHAQMRNFLERGQQIFDRIACLGIPTVAAINGACLGGGLELALACTYRIAADRGSISIGLPEVNIGLIPAWGGTTRMTRQIGILQTLPLLMAGKTMPPRRAVKVGIIDEIVRPEVLLQAAKRLLCQRPPRHQPGLLDRLIMTVPWLLNRVHRSAQKQMIKKTFGNYPAPELLLKTAYVAARRGHEAGLHTEREAAIELAETTVCKNLMRLFFLRSNAKKHIKSLFAIEPMPVNHVAVIGGGTMGAGITHSLIRTGITVRLLEMNPESMSGAMQRIHRLLEADVRSRRLSPLESAQAMSRVVPTIHFDERAGLKLVDLVIEAVAERIEVKNEVFNKLARLTRSDAVLASNTSSLSITDMAQTVEDVPRRESVIGMHFFNPVPKMSLIEIIQTKYSAAGPLATAAALSLRIGKTPIVVQDSPGFVVNRIVIPYLAEAIMIASEGLPLTEIDVQMKRWGMPMGPYELLDQIGLDIATDIFHSVGGRMGDHIKIPPGFDRVLEHGWLGKKTGRGFYIYPKKGSRNNKKPIVNKSLIELLVSHVDNSNQIRHKNDIEWRLVLPMINEAARMLHEGVFDSTDGVDLATVLGLGLAPFRGGLIQFAHGHGVAEIVQRLDDLADRYGQRFTPSGPLRELAKSHKPMQSLVNLDSSGAAESDPENQHQTQPQI